ncbi:MAG: DsbA family protein [Saprospiraceae bacterium]|nr:DsbA family protein [Saprospiraceae bacterium]
MKQQFIFLITAWLPFKSLAQTSVPVPQPHFIYIYDPLCGWCYGFSPVITKLHEDYSSKATFEVIAGGMVRGDRVGPLSDIADYLQEAYKTVEERTGVQFGQPYLDELFGDADMIMDSEPGCLAQTAINQLRPEHSVAFASAIQKAIYGLGLPPDDRDGIIKIMVAHGLNEEIARGAFSDPQLYQKMINAFSKSEGMGVRGFPTLILEIEDQRYILTRGYAGLDDLQQRMQEILEAQH